MTPKVTFFISAPFLKFVFWITDTPDFQTNRLKIKPLRFLNALCCPFFEIYLSSASGGDFPLSTHFGSYCSPINSIIYRSVEFETSSMESMIRPNTEVFSVLEYPIFDLFKWKSLSRSTENSCYFFQYSSIFMNFFNFWAIFRTKIVVQWSAVTCYAS